MQMISKTWMSFWAFCPKKAHRLRSLFWLWNHLCDDFSSKARKLMVARNCWRDQTRDPYLAACLMTRFDYSWNGMVFYYPPSPHPQLFGILILLRAQHFVCHPKKEMRAVTLRALRFLSSSSRIATMMTLFQWPLVCILESPDASHKKERTQAIQVSHASTALSFFSFFLLCRPPCLQKHFIDHW